MGSHYQCLSVGLHFQCNLAFGSPHVFDRELAPQDEKQRCQLSSSFELGTSDVYILSFLILAERGRDRLLTEGQFANYTVALTTPVFLASSSFGAYYFFAFMTLFCTIMCAFFMIETKGHSLEYIEQRYTERQSNAMSIL